MSREQWPLEIHQLQEMIDKGLKVHELSLREILIDGLISLKKIELHLSVLSGEEISDNDIGG